MRHPNYELVQRVEKLIAQECAKRGGEWQVGLIELAQMLGEDGKAEKMYRVVNYLASQGTIVIRKSPTREPHTYKYIGRDYKLTDEFVQLSILAQNLQKNISDLVRRINELQDKDSKMLEALNGLSLVEQTNEGYLYLSSKAIDEVCCGHEKKH